VLPGFLNLALATSFSRLWIQDAATGTSQSMKNISRAKLLAMPVPVPPKEEQAQIVSCIDALDVRLDRELATLHAVQQVKHSLMSVLLTGKLRVTPDEGVA
jgi:type I restriction enzyme S subunit